MENNKHGQPKAENTNLLADLAAPSPQCPSQMPKIPN